MKRIQVNHMIGHIEPVIYYYIKVYPDGVISEPERAYQTESRGNEISNREPLSVVMKYLHLHPVEPVEIDERTDAFLKPDLGVIVQAHNGAIPKIDGPN